MALALHRFRQKQFECRHCVNQQLTVANHHHEALNSLNRFWAVTFDDPTFIFALLVYVLILEHYLPIGTDLLYGLTGA